MTTVQERCNRDGYYEVSTGTFRLQDLIPQLLDVLRNVHEEAYNQAQNPGAGFTLVPLGVLFDLTHPWWDSPAAQDAYAVLCDTLDGYSPEGYYFGPNEGSSSSIGYWPRDE